jgi:hypothetical protein
MRLPEIWLIASLLTAVSVARAEVAEFTDANAWAEAVGSFNTIDFTGFPDSTLISNQFAELGVLFTDANEFTVCCSEVQFPNDGEGLDVNNNLHLSFLTPQSAIAADFHPVLRIQLFCGGSLVYTSSEFVDSIHGTFAGVVTDEFFDSAMMVTSAIDDLHFGGPIDAGDLDGDGSVGIADFLLLLGDWGPCPLVPDPCPADADHDGMVGVTDFLLLLRNWS